MDVGLVGSGPAADAVAAALSDVRHDVVETDVEGIATTDVGVVVGLASGAPFDTADRSARDAGIPWFAVELGGVGGFPVVDAAVAGFGPETACHSCLASRVGANVDPGTDPHAAPSDATARFAGAVAGRRVVSHLEDEADVLGTVVELPYTERAVLPAPDCECGDAPAKTLPGGHRDRALEESLASAERALDDRVGIVREVGEAASYPAPYYVATLCDTGGFSDATATSQAAGVDADWNAAFMRALGEGFERYCAGVYRTDDLERAPVAEAADPVAPGEFVSPDSPDPDASWPWTRAEELATGDVVSVPASLVYHPAPDPTVRPDVTTGLGLGNSGVEAVLSGLYEVIERDAAMLAWYSTFDPLGLEVDDEAYETLASRARAEGLETTAVLLTQDVDVPVVAVAVHRDAYPEVALGTAASLDPAEAARSALAEAVQNWVELDRMGPEDARDASGAIGTYASDPDLVFEHLGAESTVPVASVGPADPPSGREELEAVVERVADADCTAYAARTTTRDVEALGFEAVRVLVPSAQPLFFEEPFFGDRARAVPEDLGFEPRPEREHHPFP